jgi:fucose permease
MIDQTLSRTIGYYSALFTFGLFSAAWGPALPYLAAHTGAELGQISLIFTAHALGFFFGTTFLGRTFDRFPGHPIMAAGLIAITLLAVLVPFISNLWLLIALVLLFGLSASLMVIGGNTLLAWIHAGNLGPWMNGLHFFVGVGSFISPMIITLVIALTGDVNPAYWILALVALSSAVFLLRLPSPRLKETSADEAGGRINYRFVLPLALVFLLYVGAEVGFSGWLYTYTVTIFPGTETEAGLLTSAFWGAMTIGRLLAIPISSRIRARSILLFDLLGSSAALIAITLWSDSQAALWLGTLAFGLFMAAIFPTLLTFSDNNIRTSGQVYSWYYALAAVGALSLPFILGQAFERISPGSILTILIVDLALALFIFTLTTVTARARPPALVE